MSSLEDPKDKLIAPSAKSFTRFQSSIGYFLTIIISVFSSVLITVLFIPVIMGVNPLNFYRGEFLKDRQSKTVIKTKPNQNVISAVAEKVGPSVVTIKIYKNKAQNFLFPELGQDNSQSDKPDASGSGVVYRSDGYIITNNHVIEDANKVVVTIGKTTDIAAKVVAGDSENDIAVIKVNKSDLKAIEIGSTKELDVGDLAVAIGSPFEFQQTVTSGIISAKNRIFDITDYENQTSKTLTELLQTDAAINPGNSGGGLLNANGQLIGINTAIASTSGSSAGIGFAIPIERAKNVADQLIDKGKVSHPYIGVAIKTITAEMAKEQGLVEGVLIEKAIAGGPAKAAGLKMGDIITKVAGARVKTAEELIAAIKRGEVGKEVRIDFVRGDAKRVVQVTLQDKPSSVTPN